MALRFSASLRTLRFSFVRSGGECSAIRFKSEFHSTGSIVLHIDPLLPSISSLP